MTIFEDYLRIKNITAFSSVDDHVRAGREVFSWRFPGSTAADTYRQKAVRAIANNFQVGASPPNQRFTAQRRREFMATVPGKGQAFIAPFPLHFLERTWSQDPFDAHQSRSLVHAFKALLGASHGAPRAS